MCDLVSWIMGFGSRSRSMGVLYSTLLYALLKWVEVGVMLYPDENDVGMSLNHGIPIV